MWFGTVRGLFKFAKGQSPDQAWQKAVAFPVTSIFDDGRGNLWLGAGFLASRGFPCAMAA
jgi:ligand-binding sensor domain-containing protein